MIQMVDLRSQYLKIKKEIDAAIQGVLDSTQFIGGPQVKMFEENLQTYLDVKHVIACGNGTDALQIAMMALDLKPGDEVIVPAFTFMATAEVIALLNLKPVMVDVDPETFLVTPEIFEKAITPDTKAFVPVHLFGQCCNMEKIMEIAEKHGIYVIEDNAQAIGANIFFSDGISRKSGTIAHIGTTSFFPSKNLGCYGDGGAMTTNDTGLAEKLRMIANHGMKKRYYHERIGINSRLDAIQAAVLNIKLDHLDQYSESRENVANYYDEKFKSEENLEIPKRTTDSSHVFHQYTMKVKNGKRNDLKEYLETRGISSMIYYPVPLYKQTAFETSQDKFFSLPTTEMLSDQVLSLPIHTEMNHEILEKITNTVLAFFKQ